MSDPFLDDESSAEGSKPREGFEIILPAVTYRLASGDTDQTFSGNTFRRAQISRGELVVASSGVDSELSVMLPVSHALPQRYMRGGVPPRSITIKVWRKQLQSGLAEIAWQGEVQAMTIDDQHVATFIVSSRLANVGQRRLPVLLAGRECPHVLYDRNCKAVRSAFAFLTVVTEIDGNVVKVDSINANPDGWFQWGDLLHEESGESMTIFQQIGTVITIQLPIAELQVGDAVSIAPGCQHDILTCDLKFHNRPNYGGLPELPDANPFLPTGFGIFVNS